MLDTRLLLAAGGDSMRMQDVEEHAASERLPAGALGLAAIAARLRLDVDDEVVERLERHHRRLHAPSRVTSLLL